MTQLGAWLDDLKADRISLVALITCLNERGAIDADRHESELQELIRLHGIGAIDQKLYRAIKSKLLDIQKSEGKQTAAAPLPLSTDDDDDATRLVTAGPDATADPSPDEDFEATRLMAAPPPSNPLPLGTAAPDESTVIMSAPIKPRSPSITGDHSRSSNTSSTSSTSGASRSSLSSWKKLTEASAPIQSIGPGFMIKERFIIERKIGEGGMGVVFLALDERKVEARDRNPRVAVKILNDEFRQHPDALIALQRESRRSQQLAHDNIVRVYDFDKDGAMVYMTMEYVEGHDLKKLIRSVKNKGLPFSQAYPIIEGIASALHRAHSEGIVHSDFKPGNVMLTKDNLPKVFDFGIARAGKKRADGSMEQTVFDAGSLGALTPAYASLEMLEGADIEAQDDIYALGCVAYEILAGVHPYKKVNAEEAEKKGLVAPRIEGLTRKQWQTLKKCIAFRRKDRLTSALELIQGMRPKSGLERALPIVGIAALGLAVVGGGYGLTASISYGKKISEIESCIEAGRCTDALSVKQKLDDLKPDDRIRLSEKYRENISASFLALVEKSWDPQNKKFDYTAALGVVDTALELYGEDSAWVTQMRSDLAADRNVQLSRLNDQLGERIDPFFSGQASETDAAPMLETLDAIRMIDPVNPIFKDGWIIAAFDQAIHARLTADELTPKERISSAEDRLKTADDYLEDKKLIQSIQSEIDKEKNRYAQMSDGERAHAEIRARTVKLIDRLGALVTSADVNPESPPIDAIRETWNEAAISGAYLVDRDRFESTTAAVSTFLLAASSASLDSKQFEAAMESLSIAFQHIPSSEQIAGQFEAIAQAAAQDIQQVEEAERRSHQRNIWIKKWLAQPVANLVWLTRLNDALTIKPAPPENLTAAVTAALKRSLPSWPNLVPPNQLEELLSKVSKIAPELSEFVTAETARRNESRATHLARLESLTSDPPRFDLEWQQLIDESLIALRFADDDALNAILDRLGAQYAKRGEALLKVQQLSPAKRAVIDGMSRVGKTEELKAVLANIDSAQDVEATRRKDRQNHFKIEAMERTVSIKAMAGDIKSAIASLNRLKRLDRENAYASSKALDEIAHGALTAAKREAAKSRFENAIAKLDLALDLSENPSLKDARNQYKSEDCQISLQAELDRPGLIGSNKRKACLDHLKLNDPGVYPQFKELGFVPAQGRGTPT